MGARDCTRARTAPRPAWLALWVVLAALAAPGIAVAADPAEMLTYLPSELVNSEHSREQIEGVYGGLSEYGIGQALVQMPRFKKNGTFAPSATNLQMLRVFADAAAGYNASHGTQESVTAVFNGRLKPKGLSLEVPATRANIVASVESTLASGVGGVQLDLEPFPTGPGLPALLEELDAALARRGFPGRLSIVTPGDNWSWSPAYLARVGELTDQLDPTFYDTEYSSVGAYQELIEEGLAYYSAAVPAGAAAIVPVIPCYSKDPWHNIAIENVPRASEALATALSEGSRVAGAGLWWWYAFYDGNYKHGNAAAERAAWLSSTLTLPYTP